jgi:hypothetical protein
MLDGYESIDSIWSTVGRPSILVVIYAVQKKRFLSVSDALHFCKAFSYGQAHELPNLQDNA